MALRAKQPEFQPNRFKAVVYGGPGSGKTHFCCSLPNVYYIDTENVLKYKHYVKMLKDNNSQAADLFDFGEIIAEVKELMTVKHDYKTLVIDSLSVPCSMLAQLEIERLVKVSKTSIEGTEYAANTAKPKRYTLHLAMLLMRLDMNVIVVSHEKTKYSDGKEVGIISDLSEKMAHLLGTAIHFRPTSGYSKIAYFEKSRYPELPNKSCLPFDDGYEVLKERFGEDMFSREVVSEKFITAEQLKELKHFITVLNISDEICQKWLISAKCGSLDELNEVQATKFIDACKKKLTTKGE